MPRRMLIVGRNPRGRKLRSSDWTGVGAVVIRDSGAENGSWKAPDSLVAGEGLRAGTPA
jgi:hypothetical protein